MDKDVNGYMHMPVSVTITCNCQNSEGNHINKAAEFLS